MAGALVHSPADIIRHLFIDLGAGVLPSAGGSWPIYVSTEPDTPDSVITLIDTAGVLNGRTMFDGKMQGQRGLQVIVRDANHVDGYTKAGTLQTLMDETIGRSSLTVGSTNYFVESITRTTDIISLGKDVPVSDRNHFTINALVALRQV